MFKLIFASVLAISMNFAFAVKNDLVMLENSVPNKVGHPVEVVANDSRPKPTIILLHGCNGLNSYADHYRDVAEAYADWGYNIALIDSFMRRGFSNLCEETPLNRVWPESRAQDVSRLIDYLKRQPWHRGRVGVVGMDHGGSVVLNMAGNPTVNLPAVGIAFYPDCHLARVERDYKHPKFPVQVHVGEKDGWFPAATCQQFVSKNLELHTYPEATHWFDVPDGPTNYLKHRVAHSPEATKAANERVKNFLDRHLRGKPRVGS